MHVANEPKGAKRPVWLKRKPITIEGPIKFWQFLEKVLHMAETGLPPAFICVCADYTRQYNALPESYSLKVKQMVARHYERQGWDRLNAIRFYDEATESNNYYSLASLGSFCQGDSREARVALLQRWIKYYKAKDI